MTVLRQVILDGSVPVDAGRWSRKLEPSGAGWWLIVRSGGGDPGKYRVSGLGVARGECAGLLSLADQVADRGEQARGCLPQRGGLPGVLGGEHQLDEGGVVGREPYVGGRGRPQPRRIAFAGVFDSRAYLVAQARESGLGESVQQRLAVGEMAARRRVADACLAREANLLCTAELQRRLTAAGSRVLANAAHPGLVATNIYHHDGPRRPSDLMWAVAIRLLAQDADHGALPVLYAAVADIPGNSFAGPRHLAHMRGGAELIDRSAAAQDPELAHRLWTVSEQLTGVRSPLQPVPQRP